MNMEPFDNRFDRQRLRAGLDAIRAKVEPRLAEVEAEERVRDAAPDLLAALEALMEFWDHGTPVHAGAEVVDDARAAIARAKGSMTR